MSGPLCAPVLPCHVASVHLELHVYPFTCSRGAQDLINAFWSKSKQKGAQRAKPGPKSVTKARGKKGRADDDDEEEESEVEESPAPPKKRGRPSKASTAASRDSSEEPAKEPAPKKNPRKSAGTSFKSASTASKGKRGGTSASAARGADPDEDDDEDDFADMKQLFKTTLSWENSVEKIDTVERTPDGGLMVYFTLCAAFFLPPRVSDADAVGIAEKKAWATAGNLRKSASRRCPTRSVPSGPDM